MPPRLPGLFTGIGLESGVISYGGLYTLLVRLDFDVKGYIILLKKYTVQVTAMPNGMLEV